MSDTAYPVQLSPPDIRPWRGNTGVDYITTLDSGRPGPHVMVSAIVHGNELCGAIVLDELLRQEVRPLIGQLTLAFMNVAAMQLFDPQYPALSRFVNEDFNRIWDQQVLDGQRHSSELQRARAVRPLVDRVDYLLDLHSMQHPTEPLILCGDTAKGEALALAVGYPPLVVSDSGHSAGRRLRDYQQFADPSAKHNALLVECGQHWAESSVDVARRTTLAFLRHFGLLAPDVTAVVAPAIEQRVIQITHVITVQGNDFRFAGDYQGMENIATAGTVIATEGGRQIRTPYDHCVLIMPSRRLRSGQTAVRLGRIKHS